MRYKVYSSIDDRVDFVTLDEDGGEIAGQVARLFGHDGQRFELSGGAWINDVCRAVAGQAPDRDPGDPDTERYVFNDGSVLTITGGGWDLGFPDCFCWQEAGHSDACRGLETRS